MKDELHDLKARLAELTAAVDALLARQRLEAPEADQGPAPSPPSAD